MVLIWLRMTIWVGINKAKVVCWDGMCVLWFVRWDMCWCKSWMMHVLLGWCERGGGANKCWRDGCPWWSTFICLYVVICISRPRLPIHSSLSPPFHTPLSCLLSIYYHSYSLHTASSNFVMSWGSKIWSVDDVVIHKGTRDSWSFCANEL